MAGDWIKIRPTLITSPKVNGIARLLEQEQQVCRALTTGYNGCMSDVVTRNVMRNVTLSSLVTIWGAANEHTSDGVFKNADLSDLDDMAGVPRFGEAMEAVGWAIYDKEENTVTLPNFNEYNTCGRDRSAEKNAERQRKYREKKRLEGEKSNGDSNVTNDVTNNDREEKRREENNKGRFTPPSVAEVSAYCRERQNSVDPQSFVDHYESNGWYRGKTKIKDWKACVRTWEKNQSGQPVAEVRAGL